MRKVQSKIPRWQTLVADTYAPTPLPLAPIATWTGGRGRATGHFIECKEERIPA